MKSGFTVELWDDLRAYAQRYAESTDPLPRHSQCADWLTDQVARRGLLVSADVLDFYTSELWSMIHQLRESLDASRRR